MDGWMDGLGATFNAVSREGPHNKGANKQCNHKCHWCSWAFMTIYYWEAQNLPVIF